MRLLEENLGDARIFSTRPFGYKRYHVEYTNGDRQMFSGLRYSKDRVIELVEKKIDRDKKEKNNTCAP